MDDSLRDGFSQAWEAYRIRAKGALLEKRAQGPLTAAAARLALSTAGTTWEDPYSPSGSWLAALTERDPDAGRRVLDAVRSFSPIEPPAPREQHSGLAETGAAAVALGAAGGIGAHALGATTAVTVGAALAVAAVAGVATNQVLSARKPRADHDPMTAYLEQLDLLREEIEGVVDAGADEA